MARKQDGASEESLRRTAATMRGFTLSTESAPTSSELPEDVEGTSEEDVPQRTMRPLAALGGVGMGLATVVCLAIGIVSAGGGSIDTHTAEQVTHVRDQVREIRGQVDDLPSTRDAQRGLDTARQSAEDVARMQNDYRALTPEVVKDDGKPESGQTDTTSRSLKPYFAPTVDDEVMQPWYLLASDAKVPKGSGLAMGFDSGFRWEAQTPSTVDADGVVRVTWLAKQTRTGKDESSAVLAWRQADYDMNRKTFSDVTGGTTTVGDDLQVEVSSK